MKGAIALLCIYGTLLARGLPTENAIDETATGSLDAQIVTSPTEEQRFLFNFFSGLTSPNPTRAPLIIQTPLQAPQKPITVILPSAPVIPNLAPVTPNLTPAAPTTTLTQPPTPVLPVPPNPPATNPNGQIPPQVIPPSAPLPQLVPPIQPCGILNNVHTCYRFVTGCYCVVQQGMAFRQALDFCTAGGKRLVSIDTPEKDSDLQRNLQLVVPQSTFMGGAGFWTSGSYVPMLNRFLWAATGKYFTNTNWDTGKPVTTAIPPSGLCVRAATIGNINNGLRWREENCDAQFPVVCE